MARDKFIPAKQLNLLAAGWIQFNLHDWFDHGPVDTSSRIKIELDEDDPVYKKHKGEMKIPRTKQDNCHKYSVHFSYFLYATGLSSTLQELCENELKPFFNLFFKTKVWCRNSLIISK